MFHFLLLVLSLVSSSVPMKVSFCDGFNLITLKDNQCPGGINFGTRKPDCVCISGIYRLWMNNCVVYDGFMEQGCTALKQDAYEVVGMRLTGKIKNFSNITSAAFAEKDSDYESWTVYPIGDQGNSSADNFYTVHGKPYIYTRATGKSEEKFAICVEKSYKKKNEICRYYREDNEHWKQEDDKFEIVVRDFCDGPFGSKKVALKPQSCYSVMKESDSECSLPCWDGPLSEIDFDYPSTSTEEYTSNKIYRREIDSQIDADGNFISDDTQNNLTEGTGLMFQTGQSMFSPAPIEFNNVNLANITSSTITQQIDENNFFLNRKLNHYSKLRQIGYLKPNDLRQIPPTRTFELLEVIKDIAKKACPNHFVSSLFIDQAVDLFVILHKGRNYRYTEDLIREDFDWIKTILAGCFIDTKEILMIQEENEFSDKCKDFQKVKGVCQSPGENCTDLSISESHNAIGKFHFVVEAAWDLIDLAQIVCFPSFAQSYRMFHQWEQASEKLFTREIRKLWHNPNLSMKVYQNLLTPSAQIDMYNLEMCIEAAYTTNPVLSRLSRPSEPRKFFRRKKREVLRPIKTKQVDVYCRKTEPDFEYPC